MMRRAIPAVLIVSCILLPPITSSASAQSRSPREVFAYALGAAVVAQTNCNLPDEVQKAKAWVDSFRSGFDTWNNRDDAFLMMTTGARVEAQRKQMGTHAWCTDYIAGKKLGAPF